MFWTTSYLDIGRSLNEARARGLHEGPSSSIPSVSMSCSHSGRLQKCSLDLPHNLAMSYTTRNRRADDG
jgi:hypothetical protein